MNHWITQDILLPAMFTFGTVDLLLLMVALVKYIKT